MIQRNFLDGLRQAFYRAAFMRCYTVATDKLVGHATVTNEASPMTERGRGDSARNILRGYNWPLVSGPVKTHEMYGETTPVGSYTSAPIGTTFRQFTQSGGATTAISDFTKTAHGWDKTLRTSLPIVTSVATTALAGTTWHGMRIQSKVPTGVTSAGEQTGLYIETEVTGTGICTGSHYGLKIETYVTSGATMSGDHYGIAVFTYSAIAGNQEIYCLRLEHNGASVAGAFLAVFAAANTMRYLITSSTTDDDWMSITTTPTASGAGGWYRVKHGGYTRYIALYTGLS